MISYSMLENVMLLNGVCEIVILDPEVIGASRVVALSRSRVVARDPCNHRFRQSEPLRQHPLDVNNRR
jgi:hypothetical protein